MENQKKPSKNFETLFISNSADGVNLQAMIDDYEEIAADLIMAHNLCCHFTDLRELDARHGAAIQSLWYLIESLVKAGHERLKVVKTEK